MVQPVVVGIDPGTTTAYAVLSVQGDVIANASSRNVDTAWLSNQVIEHGKPVLVGCDTHPSPDAVEQFARRHGAELVQPDEDLSVQDKKELADASYANDHERDALAAARFAYNIHRDLLDRIKRKLHDPEVYEEVLKRETSVDDAVQEEDSADHDEETRETVRHVVERPTEELERRDTTIAALRERLENLEEEKRRVADENQRLKDRIEGMPVDEVVEEKERAIREKARKIQELEEDIHALERENERFKRFLAATDKKRVKKLDNLSRRATKDTSFYDGDIILVDDPNVASDRVLDELRGTVRYILHKQSLTEEHPEFTFIHMDDIQLRETEEFALVDPEQVKDQAEKQQILEKVVLDYKEERSHKP